VNYILITNLVENQYINLVSGKHIINMYVRQIDYWQIKKDFNKAIQKNIMIDSMMRIKY